MTTWGYLLRRAGMERVLEWDYADFIPLVNRPTPQHVNAKKAWKKRGKTKRR